MRCSYPKRSRYRRGCVVDCNASKWWHHYSATTLRADRRDSQFWSPSSTQCAGAVYRDRSQQYAGRNVFYGGSTTRGGTDTSRDVAWCDAHDRGRHARRAPRRSPKRPACHQRHHYTSVPRGGPGGRKHRRCVPKWRRNASRGNNCARAVYSNRRYRCVDGVFD